VAIYILNQKTDDVNTMTSSYISIITFTSTVNNQAAINATKNRNPQTSQLLKVTMNEIRVMGSWLTIFQSQRLFIGLGLDCLKHLPKASFWNKWSGWEGSSVHLSAPVHCPGLEELTGIGFKVYVQEFNLLLLIPVL